MKKLKIILFVLIVTIHNSDILCQNKNMENEIKNIKALGKDSIIKLGKRILKKKYPTLKINLKDYEITAWYNSKDVLVNLKRSIKFIPLGKRDRNFNYDLSVSLITKKVNPLDTFGTTRFYIPTAIDLKKIAFVKKASNLPQLGFDNEVFEDVDMYVISITNDATFGVYHIDKTTGKEIPKSSIQSSWEPAPRITENTASKDSLLEIEN